MMKQIVKILLIAIASTALLNAPLAAQIASEKTTAGKSATEKASESQSVESTPELPLTDKTLVVWVAPANLKQRGGSALTIEDGSDHFDGIVFGELTPAKWMAGSDAFTRTQRDQSDWPAETAEGATYIQLAIVYQGKQISVFRNGRLYSQHVMAALPQEFGARSIVGIGKRHRAQGDNSHFAGSIDDARIYDYALSANQLAELEPNVAADLVPWAWWTFDDEQAQERTGRFLITQLSDGAQVVDGKLVLDGKTGTLLGKSGKEIPFAYETPARPETPPENWLTYHLAHPGPGDAMPGDPNCAFFWKGRYHLHYIYTHRDGFSFAHVSSTDMLHWEWHPTTLTPPKTEHGMFSGTGFFTKQGKPAIIYHGQGSGRNQIAIAEDDQLEKWSAPLALEPTILPGQDASKIAHWDPDAWWDGDSYYALSGGSPGSGKPPTLFKSQDLRSWDYLGLFLSKDMPDVQADEDISCPNFFKLGNQHMLLCISHTLGCRYYLGQWKDEKFNPEFHARMNWKGWDCFAPESLLTPDGRRVMWAWCNLGSPQSGIQSLPRELSLPDDGVLRIKPLRELESLRYDQRVETQIDVKSDAPYRLKQIEGDALELNVALKPGTAAQFGVEVHCDEQGTNGFQIAVEPASKSLRLGDTVAPFELQAGEDLELRVFIDKNVIEVFANERQAVVASHPYDRKNVAVSLFSKGGDVHVTNVRCWKMNSIYTR
ncbi:MAG: GH32 C-terminal domain-containing protein [Pirellulaceae bacterium]|nr:GH32 C-terminal domain-containing protein [Pirellulaceae bacterium]